MICERILLRSPFLFVAAAAYSQWLCELLGKYFLVSELHNAHIVRQVFFLLQFSAAESWIAVWVLHDSLFTQFLRMTISPRHISQHRVATRLRCGGIFNYHFIANLSQSLSIKHWLFGQPFVKRFALCYRSLVCLSVCPVCLSVTLVYCGQTVGRIKMKLGVQVGLGPGHIVLGGDTAPLP